MSEQQDNWTGDVYRLKEQKAALLRFADAIGAKRKLGADEAGNPRIEGKHGRIYVQPRTCDPGRAPKFQIYFSTGHATGWRFAREALGAFARVTNDAYDEGLLLIERLPSAEEGEVIRDKLGIFKRVVYSEEVLAAKRAQTDRMNAARLEAVAGGVSEVKILDCKPVGDFAGVEIAEDPQPASPSGRPNPFAVSRRIGQKPGSDDVAGLSRRGRRGNLSASRARAFTMNLRPR